MAFRPYIVGMNRNVLAWVRMALFIGVMVGMAGVGLAAEGASDGATSKALSQALLCQTAKLLQGNVGILIGLILIFTGLWSLIKGASFMAAAPVLVIGAIITALPTLLLSMASGLGNLLVESGISKSNIADFIKDAFNNDNCTVDIPAPTEPIRSSEPPNANFSREQRNNLSGNSCGITSDGNVECL